MRHERMQTVEIRDEEDADLSGRDDYVFKLESLKSSLKLAIEKYDINSDGIIDENEMIQVLEGAVQDQKDKLKFKRLSKLLGVVSVLLIVILTLVIVLTVQLSKDTVIEGNTLTSSSTGETVQCGMTEDNLVQLDKPYYSVETLNELNTRRRLTSYMCGTVSCDGLSEFIDQGYSIVAQQTASQFNDQFWRIQNSGTRRAVVDISTTSEEGTEIESRPFDCSGYSSNILDNDLVAFVAVPHVPSFEGESYIVLLPRECYNNNVDGCLSPVIHQLSTSSSSRRRRRLTENEITLVTNTSHIYSSISCDDAAMLFGTGREIPVKVTLNGKDVVLRVQNRFYEFNKRKSTSIVSVNVGLHTYVTAYMGVAVDAHVHCSVSPFDDVCDYCSIVADTDFLSPLVSGILESHNRRFRR